MSLRRAFLGLLALTLFVPATNAQVPADQQADMILTSARKAQTEGNFPFAVQRYAEFLQKFGNHPQANQARYQLALAYLDSPDRNFDKALESLNPLVGNGGIPEQPFALYYAGLCLRGQGLREIDGMIAKPNEAAQFKQRADQKFNDAAQRFAAATQVFTSKLPKEFTERGSPELDWAARARCDQAEMELRLGKAKEAKATAEPFAKEGQLGKSKYLKLGLYLHGFAAVQTQDYLVAGRSLAQLTPFDDPHYGLHARYLLGRVFQVTDQKGEAAQAFDAVLAGYEQSKKDAAEALKKPEQFAKNPAERMRLEALVRSPPPEYVPACIFFNACLGYEAGRFGDALGKFQEFAKAFPQSPLVPEAQLRVGFCQVQLKSFPDAIATLQPMLDKQPRLADQIQFWLGKAQAGAAAAMNDPMKVADRDNALKAAINTLKAAADKANSMAGADPEAKTRRAEMLLEVADTQQFAKQYRDAAGTYEQLINEKTLPSRTEELTHRLIAALHLAGDYPRSDQVANQFLQQFPESPLRVPVLFRLAENAYFVALAAEKRTDLPNRQAELNKLFDEAAKRYAAVVEKGGEFERLSLARFGLAMCLFKKGEFDKAKDILDKIPNADRSGELAYTPYLLADCMLRQAPATVSGAGETRKLLEALEEAAGLLDGFVNANPKAPEVPDALLKLGTCQMRQAALIAVPQERAPVVQAARNTFQKLTQQFPKEPQAAQAKMENAKCMALAGDKGGAINELKQFTQDPWQNSPTAPFAVLALATLLREQNQPQPAADALAASRQKHEPNLQKDPEKLALLRYHHGVALQEAGKFGEARQALDSITQLVPNKPVAAEAILRSAQCRIAEGRKLIETARQQLANAGLKPEQQGAANNMLAQGNAALNESAQNLERGAEQLKGPLPSSDARERMYYDAAWAYRSLAEAEVAAARLKMQQDRQKALQAEADKKAAPGTKAPQVPLPEIGRGEMPVQPYEQRARAAYQNLIANFNDSLLSIDARFELAEMFAERDEFDPAIKLLKEANDVEPRGDKLPLPELVDKIRIRLGTCLAAKKDLDGALGYFEAVAGNPKSPLVAQGLYRAGEVLLAKGETAKAIERLSQFRDKGEYQNVQGVTDRALLRLGFALGIDKKWDASRQAYETLVNRFGGSPWVNDARYGAGWALQNAGQFDPAVNWYNQVIAATTTELAAKAHLQVGLCRLEQKRYGDAVAALLIVPYTFDYPELSATALCEAARALTEDKKPEQAERLLRKVIKDHPTSEWAKVAQERLEKQK
ncbi:MAG TPA: tetratricopeptide repeat protein [Gemmataceae bacterium]|jgi:TolA-binding protein|nr:tetratricopeptide repeat protein [Gemmataceae bacterium]